MWKFKNRKKSQEESIEPTNNIIERQVVDISVCDDDNDGDSKEQNNDNRDYNDKQRDDNYSINNNTETVHVDALLAKELNALSFAARESINEEIHGVNVDQIYFDKVKEREETPQLLKESFGQLQLEINILQKGSFAYQRCLQLYGGEDNNLDATKKRKRTYINTEEFRIIFLRCELFDITKAARRLINFVELMYDLYGDIGLQRRIRLDDMSDEERRIMKAGYTQLLPGRDRAGRRIVMYIGFNSTNEYTAKSRNRIAFYLQMSYADDIETQRKGLVMITWYHNVNLFDDFTSRSKCHSAISNCGLVRTGALHVCIPEELEDDKIMNVPALSSYDDNSDSTVTKTISLRSATPANVIKSMIALSISTKNRSKLRIHTGSAMECLYALQSFGIPSNKIPIVNGITSKKKKRRRNKAKKNDSVVGEDNNNSNLNLKNHTQWLQLCQLKESNIKISGKEWEYYGGYDQQQIIECLNHADVLSGRGKDVMNHPGNTVLRSIVVSKLDEYINMKSNEEKIKLTLAVVHLLKNNYSARFLKEETIETNGNLGCWVEISNKEARLKVRLAFRDKIKNQQSQQNKMIKSMLVMPTAGDNIDNTNTSNNNNDAGAIASNNITTEKNTISTNVQERHNQLPSLTTAPTMNPSINLSSSTSLSILSRTASLILERQKSNNNSSVCLQQIKQQVEEDTDSNTSLFLNQTGSGCKCVVGASCNIPNSTGKKRQLPTKSHLSCFDCVNS